MSRFFVAAGAVILSASAVLLLRPSPARADEPGASVYKAKCASCHAADGSGSSPVGKSLKLRDLRSPDVQKRTDAEMTKLIADGKGKMPAYAKKLTPEQIKSVVALVRDLVPNK